MKFCISGLAQRTHHLSIVVNPTTSLLFVTLLCYVVLCVVIALNCLCIVYSTAIWWLKSKIGVLPEAEKKVGITSIPFPHSSTTTTDSTHTSV